MPSSVTTFIFAGGGTGGHLYPGLAIAEQLKRLDESAQTLFLCSDRDIDRSVLEPEGVAFQPIPAKPIGGSPKVLLRFLGSWLPSVTAARHAIQNAAKSGPVHVIAMGGFVAAPVVKAAGFLGVPVTLVNLDAAPGKANRWIAKRCQLAFTTVTSPAHPHWVTVPPIVRRAAINTRTQRECRGELGLDPDDPVLMITGGSQGAGSINSLLEALLRDRPDALRGWQVIHQCGGGAAEEQRLRAAYRDHKVPATVVSFTRQMGTWWGASDLAVSRAGAGAVAEAWCNRIPTIFLPYPYHADQHQKLNAAALVSAGAAAVCTDLIDPGQNMRQAGELLARLLTEPEPLRALKQAAQSLPAALGAATIAEKLVSPAR